MYDARNNPNMYDAVQTGEVRTGIMIPVLYSNLLVTRVQADSQPPVSQYAATKPHS